MNPRSRLVAAIAVLFTALIPGVAAADGVAVMPFEGRASQERLEAIEQIATEILREQGHRVVPPGATSIEHPPTSDQMEAVAAETDANYVVAAEVEPLRAQYRLHVHVYYRPAGRTEDLVATVLEAEEQERLSDILGSMVRRQGLGEDALRLTGEPGATDTTDTTDADAAEQARLEEEERRRREEEEARQREEEERLREEAAEAARQEAEAQARREAEEQRTAQEAWDSRVQYGSDAPWMAQLVLGGRYAIGLGQLPVMPSDGPAPQTGGGLFDVGLRIGRTFEGIDGFEVRGGADFLTGAFTAIGLHVGAAWLGSFFVEPVYIGLGGEVGVIFTLTGAQDVGFSGRVSALFAWRPTDRFYLEASLPEIGVVSPGSGAVTIGGSLRGGFRF